MRLILYFLLLIAPPALADQDADFLAAHDAFRAADAVKLQRFAQRLKNSPLEIYVNYYQLRLGMKKADAEEVEKFLSHPEDTPIIDQLRGEWLRQVGSNQQWELFNAQYPFLLDEDNELICYSLQSRLRKHDQTALRDARALWFSGKSLPESCGVPFEAAISAGIITGQDISQRLRLALESGNVSLAKQLSVRLDDDHQVSTRALESAAADALRYLDKLKLGDSKSLLKAKPAALQAIKSRAVDKSAVAGKVQYSPYRKQVADYPFVRSLAPGTRAKSFSYYMQGPWGKIHFGGSGAEFSLAQQKSSTKGFFKPLEFPLEYLQPGAAKGWHDNISAGCLNLASAPSDSEYIVQNKADEKSPQSYACLDPCESFSISVLIAQQRSSVNREPTRPFLSDLQLGLIDTAAVESTLARIRLNQGVQSAPSILSVDKDSFLFLPSESEQAIESGEMPGWRGLLNRFGLGKIDDLTTTATDSGLRASAVCDPCTVAGEASTVSPMEWNPKLASEGQRSVVLFALQRLAKQSLDLSAGRWKKIAPYFPAPEQHYFYGWLAYEAARDLDDRALQWYKAAANTPLNEDQSEWRVRAALRAQDWPEVLASVNAMSEQQQRDSAWRYWKGRALQTLGKHVEARDLFAPLSSEYHFYGQLASEELAGAPMLSRSVETFKPDSQAIAETQALPGVQRTLALYRMGMRNEALEEWRWVIRNFNDRELITAAEIARRHEMYDRAIGAADRTVNLHDFSLRFLAPYRELLQEHVQEYGLEEAWVYGLMRQESRFVSSAKSSVGAAGLMQIMPATARWVAGKLGLKNYRNALIHQLDTNLRLGTYYMKSVLSQFDDSPVMASAAYNAGPRRAREWRGDRPMEGAIYTETIPFGETRNYVKKVMSNTVYYASQFNAPLRGLKQRLGIVPGKADGKLQLISSGEP